jgi:predicted TIM-barrel fold metal-dependent hydrolase
MSTARLLAELPLVDHHCHGLVRGELDRAGFERLLTESDWPAPAGTTVFDSQLGFAVRRWCAPLLDLEPHSSPEDYLARRAELGVAEVNRRLLAATGIGEYLVETGYRGDDLLTPAELAALTGRPARTVVRLETVAEQLARDGTRPASFAADFQAALAEAAAQAVALKSIIAYRCGLDFDSRRPAPTEVAEAAGRWLRRKEATGQVRLAEPALLRHLLWAGVDRRLPIHLHVGYGDADIELHRCNPLHLTRWLRAVRPLGLDVLLLHNYPYQREAGYLAHVYPHVYCDVGLAVGSHRQPLGGGDRRVAGADPVRQGAVLHRRLRAAGALPGRGPAVPARAGPRPGRLGRRRRLDAGRRPAGGPRGRPRQRQPRLRPGAAHHPLGMMLAFSRKTLGGSWCGWLHPCRRAPRGGRPPG